MTDSAAVPECFSRGTTLHACGRPGREALARHWHVMTCPARTLIVSEEGSDDDVFFVLCGRARVATFSENGREVMLSDIGPGEAFGIFAALDQRPRSTNVLALEESRIARMPGAWFREVFYADRDVNRAFVLYMIERIRHLTDRVTAFTTQNARQRLIAELLRLAEGHETGTDSARIGALPTQQELATLLFSQREVIGRELSKLRNAGLVERQGRALLIHSLSALRRRLHEA